jgi:hypothetical protein
MSDTFFKVNGYVSATTTIVGSWFLLPLKAIEATEPAAPDASILKNINYGIKAISLGTTYTYQYNKYINLNDTAKWLIYAFVTAHIVAIGIVLMLLIRQEGLKDQVSYGVSKYFLPILTVIIGIFHIVDMAGNGQKVSAYRVLHTINSFLNLADFAPIHEAMRTQPQIYYPVHSIRVLSKMGEGGLLLAEVTHSK